MACLDGIDPADFESGILDPGDIISPIGSELVTSASETDFFAVGYVEFEVNVTPVNYIDDVSFDFSTSNGSAIAGTHYTARTGIHVIIPAGTGLYTGQVNILKPAGVHHDKTFTVTISGAVNATIADAAAVLTIHYDPVQHPTDPADLHSHQVWGEKLVIYNEFSPCTDRNECTGYAVAGALSCHAYLDKGIKQRYDAHELFAHSDYTDELGHHTPPVCSNCPSCTAGWDVVAVLAQAKSTGAKETDSATRRKLKNWGQINGSSKANLIDRIKRRIYRDGPVVIAMIWYSAGHCNTGSTDWNTAGMNHSNYNILPDPGSTKSCVGHALIAVGWNNNIHGTGKGGFLIQSSHGTGWANGGRAWLPYSVISTRQVKNGTNSDPWFRFYWTSVKRGG